MAMLEDTQIVFKKKVKPILTSTQKRAINKWNRYIQNQPLYNTDEKQLKIIREMPKARLETLQDDYKAEDLFYLNYHEVAHSDLPRRTKDTLNRFGLKTLGDFCDVSTHMIGRDLKLGAIEGAQLVAWVHEKKGFLANHLDIFSAFQTTAWLQQGNALVRPQDAYHQWLDTHDLPLCSRSSQVMIIPQSRTLLQEMLETAPAGSAERRAVLMALSGQVGSVEKVVALDPQFIHG